MLWTVLIILIVLMFLGLPTWGYSRGYNYGYYPSGILGVIVVVVLILLLTGHRF